MTTCNHPSDKVIEYQFPDTTEGVNWCRQCGSIQRYAKPSIHLPIAGEIGHWRKPEREQL